MKTIKQGVWVCSISRRLQDLICFARMDDSSELFWRIFGILSNNVGGTQQISWQENNSSHGTVQNSCFEHFSRIPSSSLTRTILTLSFRINACKLSACDPLISYLVQENRIVRYSVPPMLHTRNSCTESELLRINEMFRHLNIELKGNHESAQHPITFTWVISLYSKSKYGSTANTMVKTNVLLASQSLMNWIFITSLIHELIHELMNWWVKIRRFWAVICEIWITFYINRTECPSGLVKTPGLWRNLFDKPCLWRILFHKKSGLGAFFS